MWTSSRLSLSGLNGRTCRTPAALGIEQYRACGCTQDLGSDEDCRRVQTSQCRSCVVDRATATETGPRSRQVRSMTAVLAQWDLPEEIWRPWATAAAKLSGDGLTDGYVEESFSAPIGRHIVMAKGPVSTHTDDGLARYSALCVVRADDQQRSRPSSWCNFPDGLRS